MVDFTFAHREEGFDEHIEKSIRGYSQLIDDVISLSRYFIEDETKVVETASFIEDLGADSLDTVELVMAFEEEFGSEISDSEAEKILTVGDAIKFIESKSN